jgi:hypothetical protein
MKNTVLIFGIGLMLSAACVNAVGQGGPQPRERLTN